MAALNPTPAALGLASPVLGPWFADATVQLQLPQSRLEVPLTLNAATAWQAPATGTLTLAVAATPRSTRLATLADANGAPPFTDGRLVALFTLLPEVEERLDALSTILPRPDGALIAAGQRTRARVRTLALEYPDAATTRLGDFAITTSGTPDPADYGLVDKAGTLIDGPIAMSQLKRPIAADLVLANLPANLNATLWAFDADGHAIDPGAVAAWWLVMANGNVAPFFNRNAGNLWASNAAGNQRTCNVAPGQVLRLVDAHRGPASASVPGVPALPAVTQATSVTSTLFTANLQANPANGVQLAFAAATGDALPPLMATLPVGTHGVGPLALWNAGPPQVAAHGGGAQVVLTRDFIEVALVDVEAFVCGVPRSTTSGADTPAGRRAADQARASTRVNVTRSTVALPATIDTVAAAFAALGTGNPVQVVAPAMDHDWGQRTGPALPTLTLPAVLPTLECLALQGGGSADGNTVGDQQVLVRLRVAGSTLGGAWVRIHAQKIDLKTGRRTPQPAAAGAFGSAGANVGEVVASLVLTLPPGRIDGTAQFGVDVMLDAGGGVSQIYPDQRVSRPSPAGGSALAFADLASTDFVLDCDRGLESAPAAVAGVASGAALVVRTPGSPDRFALLDRSTAPLAWFTGAWLQSRAAGDVLALTTPAFVGAARGDLNPPAGATAASAGAIELRIQARGAVAAAGAPLPAMERLEFAAVRDPGGAAGTAPMAAIGSAAPLATLHEVTTTQPGNPGAPGGPDVHGAGVQITQGAVADVAAFLRERLVPGLFEGVADAGANALPVQAVAAGASAQWAAVLKTVAAGVEGEAGLQLVDLGDRTLFDGYDSLAAVLGGLVPAAGALANVTAGLRSASRRLLNALGRQEALFALDAALQRARRLVYIETPALDAETVDADGAQLAWLSTLTARLIAQPALQLVLAIPRDPMTGVPPPLAWVRSALWQQALAALRRAGGDRVVVFSPASGPYSAVRMASTAVVVDDVWAMVGTTHLWRRGLSFDSSLAIAVFDEAVTFGRGATVQGLRMQLAGDRLGLPAAQVPVPAVEFATAVRRLVEGGGAGRLAAGPLPLNPDDMVPSASDIALWNRDGSTSTEADALAAWMLGAGAWLAAD